MCELHQLGCIAIVGGDQDDVVARQAAPSTTCVTHDSAPGLYLWIYSLHFSQISLEDLRKKSLIQQPILDDDILFFDWNQHFWAPPNTVLRRQAN